MRYFVGDKNAHDLGVGGISGSLKILSVFSLILTLSISAKIVTTALFIYMFNTSNRLSDRNIVVLSFAIDFHNNYFFCSYTKLFIMRYERHGYIK
jgi:hypothetical protein